ncbi:MAG TPA: hypothetical protein VNL98_09930 [Gemmatimonadales bacterium]|nr:hypothetical protein [Gemmatimonadales bacterium]
MTRSLGVALPLALALLTAVGHAQNPGATREPGARQRLESRGLPAQLAADVAAIADAAVAAGLPSTPIIAKAIEGWSKRVPAPRIVAAVRDLAARLAAGRDVLREAGADASNAMLVSASAEALGRGITRSDVAALVRSAPAADMAEAGLVVAASLAAQGLDRALAVRVVVEAYRAGRSSDQILDLPAAARSRLQRGARPPDVGRDLLEGIGRGGAAASGRGTGSLRPPDVPPGLGNLPGGGKGP